MIAISRFRYDSSDAASAQPDLRRVLDGLRGCPGFLDGTVGRALDDPSLWVVTTRWESVGAYRRALASYQVKIQVVPVLAFALDEPSAYEIVVGDGATYPNEEQPRGVGILGPSPTASRMEIRRVNPLSHRQGH